jgi:hypothetical protein
MVSYLVVGLGADSSSRLFHQRVNRELPASLELLHSNQDYPG